MGYVDGFVIPIQKKNLKAYARISKRAGKIWRKYGALDYKECVGDDLAIKGVLSIGKLAKLKPGETVIFAYIVYRSRRHRDRVNKAVISELARSKDTPGAMPFDMRRMAYSGFKVFVDE